jgi:pyruvate dehydrogenase (quinone)
VEDPQCLSEVLQEPFQQAGPAVIEAVVDPNEPPLPGKITTEQAWQFAKALGRGQKDRWELIKTLVEDKVREVI